MLGITVFCAIGVRRKTRLGVGERTEAASEESAAKNAEASKCHALMLSHVVHVSPDSRKVCS